MRLVIKNAHVFDTPRMEFSGESTIVVDNGLIASISGKPPTDADMTIDAVGQYALPGFIDGHYHFRLVTMDFHALLHWSEVEYGIVMARLARETLARGFTTVRDLGGDVNGLLHAFSVGTAQGPRVFRAGRMLTQTGGHGDMDGSQRAAPQCACEMRHDAFSIVADGVDAVRKAARHNLRDGSNFLKMHVSGGVASPRDPFDSIQYTKDEIAAVCQEAKNRHTYVAAHAYSPDSIRLAVENGVHTIEHGNLIDKDAAAAVARTGAVMVPTLCTYEAMDLLGAELGLPRANRDKNRIVLKAGLGSLEIARSAGVTLGFGTDLIGETQNRQNREFSIRAEAETAKQILTSMYVVNARLVGAEGKAGVLAEGAYADIVLSRKNPLDDIRVLSDWEKNFSHVIKAGEVVGGEA
jgi:imidazolonepropionase-like amidohydrolase